MNDQAKKDALEFLMAQKAGVLSTLSADGSPQSAFIYYIVDEDFSIYFATVVNTRKHQNVQVNNKVAFTVGTIKPPHTVQVEGVVETVTDENMLKIVTDMYFDLATEGMHHPAPITKMDWQSGLMVYRIKPTWLKWSDFSDTKKTEHHGASVVIVDKK